MTDEQEKETAVETVGLARGRGKAKTIIFAALGVLLVLFIALETVAIITARPEPVPDPPLPTDLAKGKNGRPSVEADLAAVRKKIDALLPRGTFIIVDSGRNILYLKKDGELVRQAVISCGSGDVLEEPGGGRKWIFDTPRGAFQVKSKLLNPTWIKPDWAFIEEGKKPPKTREERMESGVLGDYALGFGEGFFIHGTLYTRLLGRSVTHGCVRVGDADLKAVYEASPLGTKIYIY